MGALQIILVDGDLRRRARVSHGLVDRGIHVEPFENPSELMAHWPGDGLILVHDDDGTVASLIDHMDRAGRWLPMVAFAESPPIREVVRAMQQGVLDYIVWPVDDATLADTLRTVEERGRDLTSVKLRETAARKRVEALSQREREVLGCVAGGMSNDLIARKLGISSRTVEIHRANMLNKIGANHTSEAIRIALDAALL